MDFQFPKPPRHHVLTLKYDHILSSSQDSVQPVIIKEERLEALADEVSSDSSQYRDEPAQDNDDPDYQVDFTNTSFILCFLSVSDIYFVCVLLYYAQI